VKRGELYLAAAGSGYAGKPRPVLIVQDDALANLDSVVVCPLSSASPVMEPLRIGLPANELTGLEDYSVIMVDKVSAVPRSTIGPRIGVVDSAVLRSVTKGLATVLGFAQSV
jgi:mRNA interferase MazF